MSDVEYFGTEEPKPPVYMTIALDFENHNLLLGQMDGDITDIRVARIIKSLQTGGVLAVDINAVKWAAVKGDT